MANLTFFAFTTAADIALAAEWQLLAGQTVDALAGDDLITAKRIDNSGTIVTGAGKDTLLSTGGNEYGGFLNRYNGVIALGADDDVVKGICGSNAPGIYNEGSIDAGVGNDIVMGSGGTNGGGLVNFSIITTAAGNDVVSGSSGGVGIYNGISVEIASIDTGVGNDVVTAVSSGSGSALQNLGTIYTGAGNDSVDGASVLGAGIDNAMSALIDTGVGNDVVIGTSSGSSGILNNGTIDTGIGNDTVTGSTFAGVAASGLGNGTLLSTGAGNDIVTGSSLYGWGIANTGGLSQPQPKIVTGVGNDTVSGVSSSERGIYNAGAIDVGAGNDVVKGVTLEGYAGIFNQDFTSTGIPVVIDTGLGNDVVKGVNNGSLYGIFNQNPATINCGAGNDVLMGESASGVGICNIGTIDMGVGNDVVSAVFSNNGIANFGAIAAGAGNDMVDAGVGGFSGGGTTDLGDNNDTLKGFGSGVFVGGIGVDTLILSSGTYAITNNLDGTYALAISDNPGSPVMTVSGFEVFGSGASISSFAAAALAGSVSFV